MWNQENFRKGSTSIKKRLVTKLEDALRTDTTTFKTPIKMSPDRLVFKKACHLRFELEHKTYWVIKRLNLHAKACGKKKLLELNELDELRLNAYVNAKLYKEWTNRWYERPSDILYKASWPNTLSQDIRWYCIILGYSFFQESLNLGCLDLILWYMYFCTEQ